MPSPELHIVILAAGKGSRMRSALPKVLHCIASKPLLEHVIDTAYALKPDQIHVIVGHGKEQVQALFNNVNGNKVNDGNINNDSALNKITFVEQVEQLGTGHAVQQALPNIPDNANILILYGDVPLISKSTLNELIDSMVSFPLALLTAVMPDPTGYGRITRDDSNSVSGIVEQKDASLEQQAIREINSGFLCARSASLKHWLSQISNQNAQKEYYLTDIVALAYQSGNPVTAIQPLLNEEILGINSRLELATVERIYQLTQAERLMREGVTIIDPNRIDIRGDVEVGMDTIIDINCVIEGPTKIGNNVRIAPNCVISKAIIADDTTIHANTVIEDTELGHNVNVGPFARLRPGTKLGDDVRIGNFVETKNAQFAQGAKANHLSYVGDATVGENTNIGAGVITCNYDGAVKHQTTIGKDVFVGSDCQLVAPVEIEDGATIGAGSTITNNVGKNQLALSRTKQRQIDGWKRPQKEQK